MVRINSLWKILNSGGVRGGRGMAESRGREKVAADQRAPGGRSKGGGERVKIGSLEKARASSEDRRWPDVTGNIRTEGEKVGKSGGGKNKRTTYFHGKRG